MRSIRITTIIMAITALFIFNSCKKDAHKPPTMTLKTGAGYTSADATVAQSQMFTVGITADKVEDDMLIYNVSHAYDNTTSTVTDSTFTLTGTQQQHYDKDVTLTTRPQAGTEKWIFTITDKDGNIAQKQIVLTVL